MLQGVFDIFLLLLICLLIAFGFYSWILGQKIRFAETQVHHRLKDVIAAIHRRIDAFDVVLTEVMRAMPDETSVWQEFTEAKRTLLQALSGHDVNQIATAEAELDRAEYDMKERFKAYQELQDNEVIHRELKDLDSLDALVAKHVSAYNQTADAFNDQITRFPALLMAEFLRVRPANRFLLEQATVGDHHLEAIVLE